MGDEKVYLKFCEDVDLQKGVREAVRFGGVTYWGFGRGFAVFTTENSPERFIGDLLESGVKISVAVVKTPNGIRGILPMEVKCARCGEMFSYLRGFSRDGRHLCDGCLMEEIQGERD